MANDEQSVQQSESQKLRLEFWPVARLIPSPRNARTHSDAQIAEIAQRRKSEIRQPIKKLSPASAMSCAFGAAQNFSQSRNIARVHRGGHRTPSGAHHGASGRTI